MLENSLKNKLYSAEVTVVYPMVFKCFTQEKFIYKINMVKCNHMFSSLNTTPIFLVLFKMFCKVMDIVEASVEM